MTLPSIILGIVIALLIGAGFHLWRGGGLGSLLLYLALSLAGFWIGHIAAESFGWEFLSIGPLHLGVALIGAVALLGIGYWLSLVQTPNK